MDDDELQLRIRMFLDRVEHMDDHDLAKLAKLAETLKEGHIARLPALLARDEWAEGFWLRAKRIGATITVILGALYMTWDGVVSFILRMAEK